LTPRAGSPPAPPRVTAIVLNWCGEEDTTACLRSLLRSDYGNLDLLLVDNASPDGSGDRLHHAFPGIRYLQTGENLGYTGGNNRGIERALADGADFVLVLNNDTEVEPEAVSRLVECATREPRVGAVGPKILYAEAPDRVWFAGGDFSRTRAVAYHRREGELDADPRGGAVEEVTFLTGCCLLLPAEVLREVGAFEEDFFAYVEDVDLSLRLRERGYRLLYQPTARIRHRVALDAGAPTPFQLVHTVRNRRRLARRRYGVRDRVRFALFFYPSRLLRVVKYLSRGDTARARAVWEGISSG
jgi:GT2 family glycosyltransferase